MSVYYIRHLYIHIMFKKCQKHVKIISIKDQKQNKKFCEDENIRFNFIETKIKIRYRKTYLKKKKQSKVKKESEKKYNQ